MNWNSSHKIREYIGANKSKWRIEWGINKWMSPVKYHAYVKLYRIYDETEAGRRLHNYISKSYSVRSSARAHNLRVRRVLEKKIREMT